MQRALNQAVSQSVSNTFSFYESAALWFVKIMVSLTSRGQPVMVFGGTLAQGRVCSVLSYVSELYFIFCLKEKYALSYAL